MGQKKGGQAMSKTLDEILLDTIKRAKPDEVEPGLIWGENVARGYNKSIRLYEQNLMKELLGEQSQ